MAHDKVSPKSRFLDLSDYSRPLARFLVRILLKTKIKPTQITLVYTILGLIAAWLLASGSRSPNIFAGILLIIKSILDAADGELARAKGQPSRVGRFLDSLADFFVNALVFLAIVISSSEKLWSVETLLLAFITLESATWQATIYNYYYVYYRKITGGEQTSQVPETDNWKYPTDNPKILRILLKLYRWIYGWQDYLILKIDRWISPDPQSPFYRDRKLLTLTSLMGPGFQLILIAVFIFANKINLIPGIFILPFNIYWILILLYQFLKVKKFRESRSIG